MKKKIIVACNLASLGIILTTSGFWNNLLLFLLVGAIPGTDIIISPIVMIVGIFLVVFTFLGSSVYVIHHQRSMTIHTMPRRRYGRI